MIATSVTVTNKYQALNYRSSLRQAIAQTIDEDLTEIRLELENYLYQPKTQSLGAMLQTKIVSNQGVGTCDRMAGLAANYSAIICIINLTVKHIRFLISKITKAVI